MSIPDVIEHFTSKSFTQQLRAGEEIVSLACVNRHLYDQLKDTWQGIKNRFMNAQRVQLSTRFPSLITDIETYGPAWKLCPFPVWRALRIERWWYYPQNSRIQRGWQLEEVFWTSDLEKLHSVFDCLHHTCGLYEYEELVLQWWTWDYITQAWEEENKV